MTRSGCMERERERSSCSHTDADDETFSINETSQFSLFSSILVHIYTHTHKYTRRLKEKHDEVQVHSHFIR